MKNDQLILSFVTFNVLLVGTAFAAEKPRISVRSNDAAIQAGKTVMADNIRWYTSGKDSVAVSKFLAGNECATKLADFIGRLTPPTDACHGGAPFRYHLKFYPDLIDAVIRMNASVAFECKEVTDNGPKFSELDKAELGRPRLPCDDLQSDVDKAVKKKIDVTWDAIRKMREVKDPRKEHNRKVEKAKTSFAEVKTESTDADVATNKKKSLPADDPAPSQMPSAQGKIGVTGN